MLLLKTSGRATLLLLIKAIAIKNATYPFGILLLKMDDDIC